MSHTILANVFYAHDQVETRAKENFIFDEDSIHRGTYTKAYYIDYGNFPSYDLITFDIKAELADVKQYVADNLYNYDPEETYTFEELKELAIDIGVGQLNVFNYKDQTDQDDFPFEIIPSRKIESIQVNGYSQGDSIEVFYCPDDMEEVWGCATNDDLYGIFKNILFDSPIDATVTIKYDDDTAEQEFFYCEFANYNYEWDKQGFAEHIAAISEIPVEEVLAALPDEPTN